MDVFIKGQYVGGQTSDVQAAVLQYSEDGQIKINLLETEVFSINDIDISPRIGNSARYLGLPNGGQFETRLNDEVDLMNRSLGYVDKQGFLHYLESRKHYVALFFVLLVVSVYAGVKWGVPAMSESLAMTLPPKVSEVLGEGAFDYMDNNWLEASELSEQRQQQLRQLFEIQANQSAPDTALNINFRQSKLMGANAFALPDGSIVFTDDLINLAQDDREIEAIMLHEIGHVVHRHSLRFAIQQFGLTILAMSFTGDIGTSSGLVVGLPSLLASQGYSREMEREADDFALHEMQASGVNPEFFASMMEKLEAFYSKEYQGCIDDEKPKMDCLERAIDVLSTAEERTSTLESYLSTHPVSKERITRFRDPNSDTLR